jgi:hypothetical protein
MGQGAGEGAQGQERVMSDEPVTPPEFSPLAAGLAEKVRRANELRRREEAEAAAEKQRGA